MGLLRHPRNARKWVSRLIVVAAVVCRANLQAWPGHDWDQWRQVTTWPKPERPTDQAGRRDLAPLLGGDGKSSHRVTSVHGWEERRQSIATTIQQILGRPSNLQRPALEVRELGVEDLDGYTRRHILIRTEPDDWIPAYLLVPKKLSAIRVPAMLCLHQTVAQGKEEPCGLRGDPELALAVELVQRGYVCLAPDVIGFGERIAPGKQPYDNSLAFYRKHPEWSFMGKMVWDVGRAIDYLESLPFVDPLKIGSIGHSHGAYGTLFAAALEPRLAAAIASCGFTTFRSDPNPERWSHLTALMPQLGFYLPEAANIPFDWQHILALVAPRKLFVWYSTQDSIFPKTDNLVDLLTDVQKVYGLHDAKSALTWQAFDGPHRFPRAGREAAYRWLEENGSRASTPAASAAEAPGSDRSSPKRALEKTGSALFPGDLVARARANARAYAWAAEIRDSLVAAARPWMDLSDDDLWDLMFDHTIRRAWQVWSDGHCPSCQKAVPMYEWIPDALRQPWKMRCPQCRELFPKNDFLKFYRSGVNAQGEFDPNRADRSLLFNADHPDPSDPQHRFGVDDGEGYTADGQRWRFIGAYLIFGQWKQAIVAGIRNLSAAYVATGDLMYAHKAGILLDRVADFYPAFDFGKEGVMYEGAPRSGYVSTWHDACVEVHDLALAYDAVFEGLARDEGWVTFLAAKAAKHALAHSKSSWAEIQRHIEERIFRDTLANRPKIESNYPSTDVTITAIQTVLGWPSNRAEVMAMLDAIIGQATAVDGLTGEKGIGGYSVIAPHAIAEILGRYARAEPGFIREILRRHPRLHDMYRFHLETWCLGQYYPRTGDTGSFAEKMPGYAGLAFAKNPGINPSSSAFLEALADATGDPDFARLLYGANGSSTKGLPYDLFAAEPGAFQARVAKVIAASGAAIRQTSVNKTEWALAILRSGEQSQGRAAWLDYDSGERHGHADGMNLGLFAKGLDLLPDFGYPPVQYGGWSSPRAVWYTQTAAHNTVAVDGRNTRPGRGQTTLWFDGVQFRVVRASGAALAGVQQFERTVALVDISEADSYVIDLFRVAGGAEHTRFLHGHFGRVTTQGLSLVPVEPPRFAPVMRAFRRDVAPADGWSVDWRIEDHLKYLPPSSEVHLRHTDLTRGAEVEVAEAWVAVGLYGGTAEAWIPSVLVRRRGTGAALSSMFVGVLEPYERKSNIAGIRRLELQDSVATSEAAKSDLESHVGIELRLTDGRRDVVISRNVELGAAAPSSGANRSSILATEGGVRFEGDLGLARFDAANGLRRVVFCRGASFQIGEILIRAKNAAASFELAFDDKTVSVVAGSPDALESVEVAGTRIWPK